MNNVEVGTGEVGIITSAHNLIGNGKTFWEDIVHNATARGRCNVHVTTVATAEEAADSGIGDSSCSPCVRVSHRTIPLQYWLYGHFHWLEVKVDDMWEGSLATVKVKRQVCLRYLLVVRVVSPVDTIREHYVVDALEGIEETCG